MNDLSILTERVGLPMQTFTTKDGASLFLWENAGADAFRLLSDGCKEAGYAVLEEHTFYGVRFQKLRLDDTTLYLTFSDRDGGLRLIAKENAADLQATGMDGEAICSPLVTQLSLAYFLPDCGMSYLLRLKDGRFVIIDGGYDEYETTVHLWETLEKQNVRDGKPVIAAWFISHGHEDHFSVTTHFINDYRDRAVVQNIVYNWAHQLDGVGWFIRFCEALDTVKDTTRIVTPRSGERYSFGGMTFDALFVGEDLYPAKIPSFNDSSLILRVEAEDKVLLFPGDAEHQSSDFVCGRYDENAFRCDLLQVAHHGYYGGSEALYAAAKPEVLFWPCPDYWYPVVKEWGANPALLAQPNVKAVYIAGRMEKTFDLTKPFDYADDPYQEYESGETICEERFAEGFRIAELGWSALTGGYTGYGAPIAYAEDGAVRFKTHVDCFDVICFVQEGLLRKNPDYTLTVSGMIETAESVALFYDYTKPTVYDEASVLPLDLPKGVPFTFSLRTDSKHNKAFLSVCGKEETELPYREPAGLYLLIKDAKLTINGVRVVRN